MVAALYRDDKGGNTHTKDNSRWQISLKYDDPRWEGIDDGTVYWYIKSPNGKIIGPNNKAEDMDDGTDYSDPNASVPGRMFYKSEGSLKTDGTETSFTYFKCTKGKDKAVSCTFAYATAGWEDSGNHGSKLDYSNPSVQYWRNKSGIKYDLKYNVTSSSSIDLPYYDGTFCYVKKPATWDNIYAYAYISDNDKQTADWYGDQLTTTAEYDGKTYYLWRMSPDKKGTPAKIIFNDGGKTQTSGDGWPFTSGNVYDASQSTDYIIGTVKKQSDATDPTAAYEKFYAYGFWGEGDKSFKKMSPVVYYNANDKNVVDSVVYYVNMSKVNASFDMLLSTTSSLCSAASATWIVGPNGRLTPIRVLGTSSGVLKSLTTATATRSREHSTSRAMTCRMFRPAVARPTSQVEAIIKVSKLLMMGRARTRCSPSTPC